MSFTLTIRARVKEAVRANGVGYPESVTVTGAAALQRSSVRDIAQEAIDSMYGSYESGYRAFIPQTEWDRAQHTDAADNFTVSVREV